MNDVIRDDNHEIPKNFQNLCMCLYWKWIKEFFTKDCIKNERIRTPSLTWWENCGRNLGTQQAGRFIKLLDIVDTWHRLEFTKAVWLHLIQTNLCLSVGKIWHLCMKSWEASWIISLSVYSLIQQNTIILTTSWLKKRVLVSLCVDIKLMVKVWIFLIHHIWIFELRQFKFSNWNCILCHQPRSVDWSLHHWCFVSNGIWCFFNATVAHCFFQCNPKMNDSMSLNYSHIHIQKQVQQWW